MSDLASHMSDGEGSERRNGHTDRRTAKEDRRNSERLADDLTPRRDPERAGRRETD